MALGFVFKMFFTIVLKQMSHEIFNFSTFLYTETVVESFIKLPSEKISSNAAPFPHLCLYVDF